MSDDTSEAEVALALFVSANFVLTVLTGGLWLLVLAGAFVFYWRNREEISEMAEEIEDE